jgi:hypothetical protein
MRRPSHSAIRAFAEEAKQTYGGIEGPNAMRHGGRAS